MDTPRRCLSLGALVTAGTVLVPYLVTFVFGPLFGDWGWRPLVLVALLLEVMACGLQAAAGGNDPWLKRWDMGGDPQAQFPLLGMPRGLRETDMRWFWVGLPIFLTALGLLFWLAAGVAPGSVFHSPRPSA